MEEDDGVDNPFRPGGGLSREADYIVSLIKEGKPITPTSLAGTPTDVTDNIRKTRSPPPPPPVINGTVNKPIDESTIVNQANGTRKLVNSSFNGTSNGKNGTPASEIEVRHTMVQSSESTKPEEVAIKKKAKCKCCVVQ